MKSRHVRFKRAALSVEKLEPRHLMTGENTPPPVADPEPQEEQTLPAFRQIDFQPIQGEAIRLRVDSPDHTYLPQLPWNSRITLPEAGFESEQALREWLIESIDREYGEFFGKSFPTFPTPLPPISITPHPLPWITLDTRVFTTVANDAGSFSETNVQVEGVDEADLIETDGRFVYLVSGEELLIIDAEDPENLEIASRVELDAKPTGMYLSEDRLTLISQDYHWSGQHHSINGLNRSSTGLAASDSKTMITVLDLSDRAAPTQVQQTEMTGTLVSSRMVDGQLRLVLGQSLQAGYIVLPGLQRDATKEEFIYESRDAYLDRVVDDLVDSLLTTHRSYSADGQLLNEDRLVEPTELVNYGKPGHLHRTSIVTFDTTANEIGPADTKTIYSDRAAEVYSTEDTIYVFGLSRSTDTSGVATSIWKFDIDSEDHSITQTAQGQVDGSLLNQFSVDEHDGYLRIVTSPTGWNSGQSLCVLEQTGNQLEVVGSVHNIAPGENLYSVRFIEEVAYAVTFRVVDPLFTIDLSDPSDPQVTGELKIPGYSDYLQPLDDDHLLAIGRGADERTGRFQELQISIFDVSDMDDPQLAHRYSFEGGRAVGSIATGNQWLRGDVTHQAVGYFSSEEILAIPVQNFADTTLDGLHVFSVDTETGFESLAFIEHDSPILRSIRIGDSLLAFSAGEISTHNITNPSQQLDRLQLEIGSAVGLVDTIDLVPLVSWLETEQALTKSEPLNVLSTEVVTPNATVEWLSERDQDSSDRVFGLIGDDEESDALDAADDALESGPEEDGLGSALG